MGFFSWECKGCGKSIRSRHANSGRNKWMTKAVSLNPSGSHVIGEYDGYGRILGEHGETELGLEVCLWHQACWEQADKPEFDGLSRSAKDQGFFCGLEACLYAPGEDDDYKLGDYLSQATACFRALEDLFKGIGYEPSGTYEGCRKEIARRGQEAHQRFVEGLKGAQADLPQE